MKNLWVIAIVLLVVLAASGFAAPKQTTKEQLVAHAVQTRPDGSRQRIYLEIWQQPDGALYVVPVAEGEAM